MPKQPRPRNRAPIGDRMKVHLRVRRLAGRELRVLTLRPATEVRFSTNRYHETWHLLSSFTGGRLLAHLLWGLSFQKRPGTVFAILPPHLEPNPFDASPSLPVILVPRHLGCPAADQLRALRKALRRPGPPDRTVRWQSHGLTRSDARSPWWAPRRERVRRLGGCLVIDAAPDALRDLARAVLRLRPSAWGSDHVYVAAGSRGCWHPDGEVQLFVRYRAMRGAAEEARREVLGGPGPDASPGGDPAEALRRRIWDALPRVEARRRAGR